jgi:hypothetical protein
MARQRKKSGPITKLEADHPLFGVVEQAYKVFACAQPSSALACCEFCLPPDKERILLGSNPREIPYELLRDWYFAGVAPDVPKDLWCFLFPRILEILASGNDLTGLLGLEQTFSPRFQVGDQARWSVLEWSVIDDFRQKYLDNFDPVSSFDESFEDALIMFVLAGWDDQVLFDQVWEWETSHLVTHLEKHWCIIRHDGTINRSPWISSSWPDEERARAFFLSSRMYDRLVAYGVDAETPEVLANHSLVLADAIYWELGCVEGLKTEF